MQIDNNIINLGYYYWEQVQDYFSWSETDLSDIFLKYIGMINQRIISPWEIWIFI